MRFKILGLMALLVGGYFAVEGIVLAHKLPNDALLAQVYPLVAIFLALVVRVLQAEKHHRDRLKQSEPEKDLAAEERERALQATV
jgi:hypothetical protein